MTKTTKDGWKIHEHHAKKDIYTISKCFVADEIKYVSWEGKELKGVYDSFEQAKPKKLRTDKDWKRLGLQYGVAPKVGESWAKFKARIEERIN